MVGGSKEKQTNAERGGGGGPKSRKFCGRPWCMVPYPTCLKLIYRSFSQLLKPRQVPDTDNFYRINYGRSYGWIVVPKYWSNHASVYHCQECGVLGYNSVDLLCSSCDALVQFRLGHHSEDCKKCCKQDGDAGLQSQSKYPRAILEVCGWRLGKTKACPDRS